MELTIGQAIFLLFAVLVPGSFIMAAVDVAAEQKSRDKELAAARELQRPKPEQ